MSGKFEKRLANAQKRHERALSPFSPVRIGGTVLGGAAAGAITSTVGPGASAAVGLALGAVSLALSPKWKAGVGEAALQLIGNAVAAKSAEYAPRVLAWTQEKVKALKKPEEKPIAAPLPPNASELERIIGAPIPRPEAVSVANGTHAEAVKV